MLLSLAASSLRTPSMQAPFPSSSNALAVTERKIRDYFLAQASESEKENFLNVNFQMTEEMCQTASSRILQRSDSFLGLLTPASPQTTLRDYLAYIGRKDDTKAEILGYFLFRLYAPVEAQGRRKKAKNVIGHMRTQEANRSQGIGEGGKSVVDTIHDLSYVIKPDDADDMRKIVKDGMQADLPADIYQKMKLQGDVTLQQLLSSL